MFWVKMYRNEWEINYGNSFCNHCEPIKIEEYLNSKDTFISKATMFGFKTVPWKFSTFPIKGYKTEHLIIFTNRVKTPNYQNN